MDIEHKPVPFVPLSDVPFGSVFRFIGHADLRIRLHPVSHVKAEVDWNRRGASALLDIGRVRTDLLDSPCVVVQGAWIEGFIQGFHKFEP